MSRTIINNLLKKFDTAQKSRAKELRLSINEVREFQLALTQLLLDNSELRETASELRNKVANLINSTKVLDDSNLDGGTFR